MNLAMVIALIKKYTNQIRNSITMYSPNGSEFVITVNNDGEIIAKEINYLMDSLVVEISNRCLQKVIFKGGLPVTTKQSVREHGYGLKNVKKVLDKYISTLDFECSDERFTVKILMKI